MTFEILGHAHWRGRDARGGRAASKADDGRRPTRRLALWRIGVALAVAAAANARAQEDDALPAFKQLDSMEARVQGCVTCHGQSGQGTTNGYYPRIAGKPAGYLYNQLVAFRDGTRRYAPMNYLVAYLPNAYLREIAEHYAKQRPPFAARSLPNVDQATLQLGQSLVVSGDPKKGVPACAACHGPDAHGMGDFPRLAGQHAQYVLKQLASFQSNMRKVAVMHGVAQGLKLDEMSAVAAYLEAQR